MAQYAPVPDAQPFGDDQPLSDGQPFGAAELQQMQRLAAEVYGLRPELVNNEATVGCLAWSWAKDHEDLGSGWRVKLISRGDRLVAWGWCRLPYQVARTDGGVLDIREAELAWQAHPDHPEALPELLDWFDSLAPEAEHRTTARAVDQPALDTLATHGYHHDADFTYWCQLNHRELTHLAEPLLPAGFFFRNAAEVGPDVALRAHHAAWHPSSFTRHGLDLVQRTWPYRPDLHVLVEAADGTPVASAIAWLDPQNNTAEFEPVGTHRDYRQLGLGKALQLHGMRVAKSAGATTMLVVCLGHPTHQPARSLYYSAGFRHLTHDIPHLKHP